MENEFHFEKKLGNSNNNFKLKEFKNSDKNEDLSQMFKLFDKNSDEILDTNEINTMFSELSQADKDKNSIFSNDEADDFLEMKLSHSNNLQNLNHNEITTKKLFDFLNKIEQKNQQTEVSDKNSYSKTNPLIDKLINSNKNGFTHFEKFKELLNNADSREKVETFFNSLSDDAFVKFLKILDEELKKSENIAIMNSMIYYNIFSDITKKSQKIAKQMDIKLDNQEAPHIIRIFIEKTDEKIFQAISKNVNSSDKQEQIKAFKNLYGKYLQDATNDENNTGNYNNSIVCLDAMKTIIDYLEKNSANISKDEYETLTKLLNPQKDLKTSKANLMKNIPGFWMKNSNNENIISKELHAKLEKIFGNEQTISPFGIENKRETVLNTIIDEQKTTLKNESMYATTAGTIPLLVYDNFLSFIGSDATFENGDEIGNNTNVKLCELILAKDNEEKFAEKFYELTGRTYSPNLIEKFNDAAQKLQTYEIKEAKLNIINETLNRVNPSLDFSKTIDTNSQLSTEDIAQQTYSNMSKDVSLSKQEKIQIYIECISKITGCSIEDIKAGLKNRKLNLATEEETLRFCENYIKEQRKDIKKFQEGSEDKELLISNYENAKNAAIGENELSKHLDKMIKIHSNMDFVVDSAIMIASSVATGGASNLLFTSGKISKMSVNSAKLLQFAIRQTPNAALTMKQLLNEAGSADGIDWNNIAKQTAIRGIFGKIGRETSQISEMLQSKGWSLVGANLTEFAGDALICTAVDYALTIEDETIRETFLNEFTQNLKSMFQGIISGKIQTHMFKKMDAQSLFIKEALNSPYAKWTNPECVSEFVKKYYNIKKITNENPEFIKAMENTKDLDGVRLLDDKDIREVLYSLQYDFIKDEDIKIFQEKIKETLSNANLVDLIKSSDNKTVAIWQSILYDIMKDKSLIENLFKTDSASELLIGEMALLSIIFKNQEYCNSGPLMNNIENFLGYEKKHGQIIDKVLNRNLYNSEIIMSNLGRVLPFIQTDMQKQVINKILDNKNLYSDENIWDNLELILYYAQSNKSEQNILKILDNKQQYEDFLSIKKPDKINTSKILETLDIKTYPKSTPPNTLLNLIKESQVVEIGDEIYVRENDKMTKLNISKQTFQKLFPANDSLFKIVQGKIGDCYLIANFISMLYSPKGRIELYKSFSENKNGDIDCTLRALKEYNGTMSFPKGELTSNVTSRLSACLGLQMMEETFANRAFRYDGDPVDFNKPIQDFDTRIGGEATYFYDKKFQPCAIADLTGAEPTTYANNNDFTHKVFTLNQLNMFRMSNEARKLFLTKYINDENNVCICSFDENDFIFDNSLFSVDITNHAFSIIHYDENKEIVHIANPHNGNKIIKVPFSEFVKNLKSIQVCNLAENTENKTNGLETDEEKSQKTSSDSDNVYTLSQPKSSKHAGKTISKEEIKKNKVHQKSIDEIKNKAANPYAEKIFGELQTTFKENIKKNHLENNEEIKKALKIISETQDIELKTVQMTLLCKISENEKLYKCKNLMDNLDRILLFSQRKDICDAKISLLNTIISNDNTSNCKNLMDNLAHILIDTSTNKISDARISFLEKINQNENLYKCKNLMDNLGNILGKIKTQETYDKIYQLINKITSNEQLSDIDNLMNNMGNILLQIFEKAEINENIDAKISLLDKIVQHKELYECKDIRNTIGDILYSTTTLQNSEAKTLILDAILQNEKYRNNREIMYYLTKNLSVSETKKESNEIVQVAEKMSLYEKEAQTQIYPKQDTKDESIKKQNEVQQKPIEETDEKIDINKAKTKKELIEILKNDKRFDGDAYTIVMDECPKEYLSRVLKLANLMCDGEHRFSGDEILDLAYEPLKNYTRIVELANKKTPDGEPRYSVDYIKEFLSLSPAEYSKAIAIGDLLFNGKPVFENGYSICTLVKNLNNPWFQNKFNTIIALAKKTELTQEETNLIEKNVAQIDRYHKILNDRFHIFKACDAERIASSDDLYSMYIYISHNHLDMSYSFDFIMDKILDGTIKSRKDIEFLFNNPKKLETMYIKDLIKKTKTGEIKDDFIPVSNSNISKLLETFPDFDKAQLTLLSEKSVNTFNWLMENIRNHTFAEFENILSTKMHLIDKRGDILRKLPPEVAFRFAICEDQEFNQMLSILDKRPEILFQEYHISKSNFERILNMSDEEWNNFQLPISERNISPIDEDKYRKEVEKNLEEEYHLDMSVFNDILKERENSQKSWLSSNGEKTIAYTGLPNKVSSSEINVQPVEYLLKQLKKTGQTHVEIADYGGLKPVRTDSGEIKSKDTWRLDTPVSTGIVLNLGNSVNWSNSKMARDLIQNFYDGNGYTMEGVTISVRKNGEKYSVKVTGKGIYDYNRILSFGDSSKTKDNKSAGEYGEGSKIIFSNLLYSRGAEHVKYSAGDWELELTADKSLPPEKAPIMQTLTKAKTRQDGNSLEFETDNLEFVQELIKAKDYFYSPENKDFQNLDYENDFLGIKFLPNGEKGNIYIVQRYEVEGTEGLDGTIPGMTLIFKTKPDSDLLKTGRDRVAVSAEDIRKLVSEYAETLKNEDLINIIGNMKDTYLYKNKESTSPLNVNYCILRGFILEAASRRLKIDFGHEKYIALDSEPKSSDIGFAKDMGRIPVVGAMSVIGVPSLSDYLRLVGDNRKPITNLSNAQKKKLKLVDEAVKLFSESLNISDCEIITPQEVSAPKYLADKITDAEDPTAGLAIIDKGEYRGHWINPDYMDDFADIIATSLHEISHKVGGDGTTAFNDRLIEIEKLIVELSAQDPNFRKKLVILNDEFDKVSDAGSSDYFGSKILKSLLVFKSCSTSLEEDEILELKESWNMKIAKILKKAIQPETHDNTDKNFDNTSKQPIGQMYEYYSPEPIQVNVMDLPVGKDYMEELKTKGNLSIIMPKNKNSTPIKEDSSIKPSDKSSLGKTIDTPLLIRYNSRNEWSIETIARDIFQNFYDGQGGTLDGVKLEIKLVDGKYKIKISGDSEYGYFYLENIGASTKTNNSTKSGGFGEGAKMASKTLLAKNLVDSISFSSGEWRLDFSREEGVDSQDMHMERRLTQNTNRLNGNSVEFETTDESLVQAIISAKDYFNHSDNPDFKDFDFENSKFAYKILAPGENGNLYYGGQRYALKEDGDLDGALNGIRIVFKEKLDSLTNNRDRSGLTNAELSFVMQEFAKSMTNEEIISAIQNLENFWTSDKPNDTQDESPERAIAEVVINEAYRRNIKINSENVRIVAEPEDDLILIQDIEELKKAGYKFAISNAQDIGFKTIEEVMKELNKIKPFEITDIEKQKLALLKEMLYVEFMDNPKKIEIVEKIPHCRSGMEYMPFEKCIAITRDYFEKSNFDTLYAELLVWCNYSDMPTTFGYNITDLIQKQLKNSIDEFYVIKFDAIKKAYEQLKASK